MNRVPSSALKPRLPHPAGRLSARPSLAAALLAVGLGGLAGLTGPAAATAHAQEPSTLLAEAGRLELALRGESQRRAAAAEPLTRELDARRRAALANVARSLAAGDDAAAQRELAGYIRADRPPREAVGPLVDFILAELTALAANEVRDRSVAVRRLNASLEDVGDLAELEQVHLQDAMERQRRLLALIAEISRSLHETITAITRNIGG